MTALHRLWDGASSEAGQVIGPDGDRGRMMKRFSPFESVRNKGKKRRPHNGSGVENYCPVWLWGNSFIFASNLQQQGNYCKDDGQVNQLSGRKFGLSPNHCFKPWVMHLDRNNNSAEGQGTLTTLMSSIIVSVRKRQKQEGHSTETNVSLLAADKDF